MFYERGIVAHIGKPNVQHSWSHWNTHRKRPNQWIKPQLPRIQNLRNQTKRKKKRIKNKRKFGAFQLYVVMVTEEKKQERKETSSWVDRVQQKELWCNYFWLAFSLHFPSFQCRLLLLIDLFSLLCKLPISDYMTFPW